MLSIQCNQSASHHAAMGGEQQAAAGEGCSSLGGPDAPPTPARPPLPHHLPHTCMRPAPRSGLGRWTAQRRRRSGRCRCCCCCCHLVHVGRTPARTGRLAHPARARVLGPCLHSRWRSALAQLRGQLSRRYTARSDTNGPTTPQLGPQAACCVRRYGCGAKTRAKGNACTPGGSSTHLCSLVG